MGFTSAFKGLNNTMPHFLFPACVWVQSVVGSAKAQGMDANPPHKAQNRDINTHACRKADLFSCSIVQLLLHTYRQIKWV